MFNLPSTFRYTAERLNMESYTQARTHAQWRTEGWGFGGFKPPAKIPKALQNRAKLNPIAET